MNSQAHRLDDVTVIVVTYNSAHCLATLAPLLRECAHVIVFDNDSQDGTLTQARERLPHAHLIASAQNLGFGAANNRALAQVRTPFAMLLNPDCEMERGHLEKLLGIAAQFPEAALVAPQLMDARGRAEVNYRWPTTHWVSKGPAASGPICVGFLCGAAMLLRLPVCAPVGFFDERFFLYYEDDDLCLRLFQAQLPMLLVPDVQVVHRSRGSVKSASPWRSEYGRGYHHAQSKLIFAAKHQGLNVARALRTRLLWQTALALPLRVLAFSPRLIGRMWGRLRGVLQWAARGEAA